MRVGIFGGAFDPPHIAHLLMAELAAEELSLDHVWFIPTGRPPHGKVPIARPVDRMMMTTIAVGPDHPRMRAHGFEIARMPEVSYMVNTLEWAVGEFRRHELFLIMGDDEFSNLHQWHAVDRITELARIVCVQRDDWGRRSELIPWTPLQIEPIFVRCPGIHWSLSSTVIRERIAAGKSVRYLVPDAVREYIEGHGLYRESR